MYGSFVAFKLYISVSFITSVNFVFFLQFNTVESLCLCMEHFLLEVACLLLLCC